MDRMRRLSGDVKPRGPGLTGLTANLLQSLPPGDGQLPILPAHLPGTEAGLIDGSEILPSSVPDPCQKARSLPGGRGHRF
jgi:hypothetical protein